MKLQALFDALISGVSPDGTRRLDAVVDPHAAWRACGGRVSHDQELWDDFVPSRQGDRDLSCYVRRRVMGSHTTTGVQRVEDVQSFSPRRSSDNACFSLKRLSDTQPLIHQRNRGSATFAPKRSSDRARFVCKRLSDRTLMVPKRRTDNNPFALKRASDGVGEEGF